MKWCDYTTSVKEWGSEEIIIPYISPVDGKRHRYFPDFYVKIQNRKYLVEVKPFKQTLEPKTQKRNTNCRWLPACPQMVTVQPSGPRPEAGGLILT